MAIVEQGTVHGAARAIGLSQTGVTQRIRALERHLGVTLFTRSRKGMKVTAEGSALIRYCQKSADLEGELLSFLSDNSGPADITINITGPSSLMRCRVIPQVTKVLSDHTALTLHFHLDDYESGLVQLKTGAAQLAIMPRADVVNELDSKLLKPGQHRLLGPAAWAGRTLEDIVATERIIDFNETDNATYSFLKECGMFKYARKNRHFVNNPDAIATMIADSIGYSVLPDEFAQNLLAEKHLVDLCPHRTLEDEVALAWYPRHEMPAYFKALITAIT